MELAGKRKLEVSASLCHVDVIVDLTDEEYTRLISTGRLHDALSELHGFVRLQTRGDGQCAVAFVARAHPLNMSDSAVREQAREIYAAVERIAKRPL